VTAGPPLALPPALLAALRGRDEVLVTSRADGGTGTVRMSFAVAPPGVVYLLTSAFSRKALRWEHDPWVRLRVPGTDVFCEASVRRVDAAEIDADAQEAILERFATAGAATAEALRQMLVIGTHRLLRVEGSAGHP